MAATFHTTYNSFSGVDLHVVMGDTLVGEVQGLSYTVTREKAPLYTMGSADPRSFSRGKRGIAGSMVMLVFDRDALLGSMAKSRKARYVANKYEVREQDQDDTQLVQNEVLTGSAGTFGSTVALGDRNRIGADKVLAKARYHDQILPFNIVITAANEYGHVASMAILNVEIMNMGTGMSIDDISIDESCTFVCTGIDPWDNQKFIRNDLVDTKNTRGVSVSGGGAT